MSAAIQNGYGADFSESSHRNFQVTTHPLDFGQASGNFSKVYATAIVLGNDGIQLTFEKLYLCPDVGSWLLVCKHTAHIKKMK